MDDNHEVVVTLVASLISYPDSRAIVAVAVVDSLSSYPDSHTPSCLLDAGFLP